MIKCDKAFSKIQGGLPTLLSEYTTITGHLYKAFKKERSEEFAKDMLKEAFDMGLMSEEQLDEKIRKSKQDMLLHLLNRVFGGKSDADN